MGSDHSVIVEELRNAFFEARDHRRIPSASLVPYGDPSLLFTSAGMVQFKPYFLGLETPPAARLTSVQKCFRATDIESVGDDSHLTFFEMLGNFSLGDYFKAEAIEAALGFLVGVLELDFERLWVTVYTDDDEAFELWRGQGVPAERILRYSAELGNYWYSGDTGPCGPCSELHYYFGDDPASEPRLPDGQIDLESPNFLEVWNLVFMAFDRAADGSLTPLPSQNIDTGVGLERLAWVQQDVRSVYETDQLRSILASAEAAAGIAYDPDGAPAEASALRTITEHARAAAFLINDGVLPGNEGRGYVLRRVLRRAIYFGYTIGLRDPFIEGVIEAAIDASKAAHPGLDEQRAFIVRVAGDEERRFQAALTRGIELLEGVIEREASSRRVPGREMFTLYDTHGLPPELTRELAAARGYDVDEDGFEAEMAAQRERSRGETGFSDYGGDEAERFAALGLDSAFLGYEALEAQSAVVALFADGERVDRLDAGAEGEVVLGATAFYAEAGGQVGDRGEIISGSGRFRVDDTQPFGGVHVHRGEVVEGALAEGEAAEARVDPAWRAGSRRNHTATHLLHAALREVLGQHVRQAGSLVAPDHLRFDYTHPQAPAAAELREAQRLVNAKIRDDIAQETFILPYEEAIDRGAIAFFEDRYTSEVRMVEYCEARVAPGAAHRHTPACFSRELCGGTHLHSTGGVGNFVITGDSSIGAGLRRIEALTGPEAERYIEERLELVDDLSQRFKAPPAEIAARIDALEEQLADERRRAQAQSASRAAGVAEELADQAEHLDGVQLLVAVVEADSADALRGMADRLRERMDSAFVTLGAVIGDRPQLLALATDDVVARGLRADEVVKAAGALVGGGGGGRPGLAQAGGRDASRLGEALEAARALARERLGGA
ncbi:MAG: alanine--tRNA ligase [Chloroflexi bacterium]|nr:alanine--tRNA ligase [Chloroflexota bacterium]